MNEASEKKEEGVEEQDMMGYCGDMVGTWSSGEENDDWAAEDNGTRSGPIGRAETMLSLLGSEPGSPDVSLIQERT